MSRARLSGQNPLVCGGTPPPFPAFHARWPWLGGDLQTLHNFITHRAPDFAPYPAQRVALPMADGSGDCLSALLNRPGDDSGKAGIILVHGLTGSEDSRNIKTSAGYHLSRGHPVIRLNLRGAGPSRGQCRGHYHAGRSADLRDALKALPADLKARGLLLVGVSLGGNVCLKMLAEQDGIGGILAAATVCAPIDLKMAQQRIAAPRNAVYQRHLLRYMCGDARAAGTPEEVLARIHTVYDFDNLVVAPGNGFADAEDYYRRSSAGPVIDSIQVPTLLLHALNDPWVPARMYLDRTWQKDGAATLLMSPGGGHVGFHAADHPIPWHDRCIGLFFDSVLARRSR
jgi:predicted alpha/beta-fold hydrolase